MPPAGTDLGPELIRLWPSYLPYSVSFLVIGAIRIHLHPAFTRLAPAAGPPPPLHPGRRVRTCLSPPPHPPPLDIFLAVLAQRMRNRQPFGLDGRNLTFQLICRAQVGHAHVGSLLRHPADYAQPSPVHSQTHHEHILIAK